MGRPESAALAGTGRSLRYTAARSGGRPLADSSPTLMLVLATGGECQLGAAYREFARWQRPAPAAAFLPSGQSIQLGPPPVLYARIADAYVTEFRLAYGRSVVFR